jgi:hypothetical protein
MAGEIVFVDGGKLDLIDTVSRAVRRCAGLGGAKRAMHFSSGGPGMSGRPPIFRAGEFPSTSDTEFKRTNRLLRLNQQELATVMSRLRFR